MKILFASPYCLLDPTSGASITCRTVLEGLAARGHKAMAVSATVFDRPRFNSSDVFLERIGARKAEPKGPKVAPHWTVSRAGVHFLISKSKAQNRSDITSGEILDYQGLFKRCVLSFKPDVVMAYGGKPVDRDNFRWLQDHNIPVVFYLANPNYFGNTFRDVDLILTDTEATRDLYKKRLNIDPVPIGKIITPFMPPQDAPRDCVTFINPAPEKGAAIFLAIVAELKTRGVDANFLVVESRTRLQRTARAMNVDLSLYPNVRCIATQSDMRAVWRHTKIVLHPSLWHESGSRVILEAASAGAPTLATASGGIPETIGNGGFLFPMPKIEGDAYLAPVAPEVVREWADTLQKLLTDPAFYAEASGRALARWNEYRDKRDPFAYVESILGGVIARKAAAAPAKPLAAESAAESAAEGAAP